MYLDPAVLESPGWRGDPQRRLSVSLLMATAALSTLLSQVDLEWSLSVSSVEQLIVNIIRDEPKAKSEPVIEPQETPTNNDVTREPTAAVAEEPTENTTAPIDWNSVIKAAVTEMSLPSQEPTYSISPRMDRLRDEAAVKFRPSEAPVERDSWANIETDLLGRKILRHGDCYRVIDDPNVGSREAFETFGQFIVMCSNFEEKPKKLPWVDEVNARREALSRYAPPSVE